ncbi:hypothetical protein QBC39DRAFT_401637 [Podospora conica]|nr:hypothetical protein QBC39DRAFT_401637 [Schizothecium conicum]
MGLAERYPSLRAAHEARSSVRVSAVTLPALIAIIIAGTFIVLCATVYFGLWYSRYTAEKKEREAREDTLSVQGDFTPIGRRSSSRKLQKSGWQAMRSEETLVPGRRNHQRSLTLPTIPRVFSMRRPSRNWAAMESDVKSGKTHPAWIDSDALHGPEMNTNRGERARESWPLGPMPPIPKHYHTVHGYPHGESSANGGDDSLQGIDHVRSAYGQLRMFSRVLPEPPQPALVASHIRPLSRAASTGHGSYFDAELRRQGLQRQGSGGSSNHSSPVRSLPPTPTKIRPRQPSTDTTLSHILRSTERRLQEVAGSRSVASPNRMGTSRESLLIPAEKADDGRRLSRSLTQPRTPSPNKTVPTRSATMGHKRQPSETSLTSETDSALEELLVQSPMSGLTSPSRKQPTPQHQPEQAIAPPAQSARSSVSSALSTVYSEDERSEAAKTANNTPCGGAAERVKNLMVRPESMGDPFSNSPRPLTAVGLPARQKPDLFRESLERSQRQRRMTLGQQPITNPPERRMTLGGQQPVTNPPDRRMTLGQPMTSPPEVKLPPCPVVAGRKSLPISHLPRPEPQQRVSTPDSAASSLSKIPVKINPLSSQQAANLAKLGSIILPPPTSSYRPASDEPSSPTRLSRTANPPRRVSSISSSVYSQDTASASAKPSPALLNVAAFQSNHALLPPAYQNQNNTTQQTQAATNPPLFRATPPTPTPPRQRPAVFDPMNPACYLPLPGEGLTLTIAELRRMNSAVSLAASVDQGYGREGHDGTYEKGGGRRRSSSIFSPWSGGSTSGSRAYLSLGSPARGKVGLERRSSSRIGRSGSPRRRVGVVDVAGEGEGEGGEVVVVVQGKENVVGLDPFGTPKGKGKVPEVRVVVHGEEEAEARPTTPFKRRRFDDDEQGLGAAGRVWESPAKRLARRGSQESLGLYDADGFLIGTPVRKVASGGSGGGGGSLHKVQGSPLRA